MMVSVTDSVYPALLRYWRGSRGHSQLDLAGAADVSAKHISFLETGRARPSREMVLRLATTLDVPLRDQNTMLEAAGFSEGFAEPEPAGFDPAVRRALETMMRHQEPYPLLVFDRHYDLVMSNTATDRLLRMLLGDRAQTEHNLLTLMFDPELLRPFIVDWETAARTMLVRLQREAMLRRHDDSLTQLLAKLCAYEGVPAEWRTPDLLAPTSPTLQAHFEYGGQRLGFLVTLTVFQGPQNVSLDELRIESYFPLDEATEGLCRGLAAADASTPPPTAPR